MAGTLFDTMFGAWNAGTQAQEQQTQLQLDQQQVQFNKQTLMSMQAAQQAAYQIFGPGGPAAAMDAMNNPSEQSSGKLKQMAQWLLGQPYNKGYLDDGIKMMTAASMIDERTAKTKADNQAAAIKKWTDLGSQAGSILQTGDQDTYAANYQDFISNVPPAMQRLFNGNLQHDAKGLQYLATRGETYSQQQTATDRENRQADQNTLAEGRLRVMQGNLDDNNRRTNAQLRNIDNMITNRDKNEQRLADRDAWYRDHPRSAGKVRDGLTGKIPAEDLKLASDTLTVDDRTQSLSSDDQGRLATAITDYARKTYMGHDDPDHDLAFPDAFDKALNDYDSKGLLTQKPGGKVWSGPKPVVPQGAHHPFSTGGKTTPAGSSSMNVDAQINSYTDFSKLAADFNSGKLGADTPELRAKVVKKGNELAGGK